MTPEEERKLREWVIEHILSHYENRWGEQIIRRLLDEHGSPRTAYENMSADDSFHLGNGGYVGSDVWLDWMGGAKSSKIKVWVRPGGPRQRKADLAISWLGVFEHVAGYGEQLGLF
jgi:hypothetical protein